MACTCTGRVFTNCSCPVHDPEGAAARREPKEARSRPGYRLPWGARVPPAGHIRKVRARLERMETSHGELLAGMRAKQSGPQRRFADDYDLLMRSVNGVLRALDGDEEEP